MALISYEIDFKNTVSYLLGTIHRKVKRIAWLTASLKPLSINHQSFVDYVTKTKYDIKWNGQTIKLEYLLVEKFGEGITISNNILEFNGAFVGEGNDNGFFIGQNNDTDQFVDVTYSVGGTNFTVNVPSGIVFSQSEMEALINKYKMFGTTFNIVII